MSLNDRFSRYAEKISNAMGHPAAFGAALLIVAIWLATGPAFGWSNSHSLAINTITTICTFLLGFLILNTSIRQSRASQLKQDETIRAIENADNRFIHLEQKTDEEVRQREAEIRREEL